MHLFSSIETGRPFISHLALPYIGLYLGILLFSCQVCTESSCINGACVDNSCICEDWYEGNDCGIRMSKKFSGIILGAEQCPSGTGTDIKLVISESRDAKNRIRMRFAGIQFFADLNSEATFVLPMQDIQVESESATIEGSGSISGAQFVMSYTLTRAGIGSVSCTFSGEKQEPETHSVSAPPLVRDRLPDQ